MKKRTMTMLVTVAIMATACEKNEDKTPRGDVQAVFSANIGNPLVAGETATTPTGRATGSTWDEQDAIGIYASESTNKDEQNWKYTRVPGKTGAEAWTSERPFYFKDTEADAEVITFWAYYPWTDKLQDISIDSKTVTIIKVDASDKQTPELQKTIDFMFADKEAEDQPDHPAAPCTGNRDEPSVNFQFRHCMSKVVFKLAASEADGVTNDDIKAMTGLLTGVKSKGTFRLDNGTITDDDEAATDLSLTTVEETDGKITVSAIVVPQKRTETTDARLALKKTVTNEVFKTQKLLNFNLEAGKKYTYTITVKKLGLKITASDITDWKAEEVGNEDAILQ